MGVSTALNWWSEWQLRILVLSSLGVQYFLAIFAGRRKFRIPPWYRFFIWLSYLGSDALAIYALAMLFNRQKKQQYSSAHGNRDLEVLWAPILLMHLGGQMIITAYNIEDNELWRRHIVVALSQVTVAIYVFCKSWSLSSDRRLLAAAILLFISGIAKCFEKPLSLMRSSYHSLTRYLDPARRTTTSDREEELEEYVQEARTSVQRDNPPPTLGDMKKDFDLPDKLLVDFAYPYSNRLAKLKFFMAIDNKSAYEALKNGLSNIFDLLYTKDISAKNYSVLQDGCFLVTWILGMAMPIVAIGLFHSSHKQAYIGNDVVVTFVLLYGTLILELVSFCTIVNFDSEWPDMVAQHSLIWFFAHNKRHTKWMSFARWVGCKDLLDQYWCMKSCYSSEDITSLVHGYVKDWWKKCITDAESYMMFNDVRGQWTLEQETCDQHLGWSLEKPFDESIILWHMATDFCYHLMDTSSHKCARRCREMSNYMMHLLFANPEMLMSGSRRNLVTTAYEELEDILKGEDILAMDDENFAERVVNRVKSAQGLKESFVRDAWVLAKGLMNLGDEKMWEVIQGVWVEMLCFSASRCRGYLHAKSLGTGVEYLSYVWLLLAHAGMETFPERLQRTRKLLLSKKKKKHLQNGGENVAAPSTPCGNELSMEEEKDVGPWRSQNSEIHKEEETSATPSSSPGKSTTPELHEIVVSP